MHKNIVVGAVAVLAIFLSWSGWTESRPRTQTFDLEIVGQFGGASYAAAAQPPYLYAGVGPRLVVLDVSQPEQPRAVGQTEPLPGVVRAVAVQGDEQRTFAFVAAGLGGLQVIDVTDPAQPVVVASHESGGYAEDLVVAAKDADGTRLYLASTPRWDGSNWVGASLQIVDVSDPLQPRLVSSYDTPGYEHGVAVAEPLVFVADGDGGLQVLDVSDAVHPRALGYYDTPGYALDVAVADGLAYVADFTAGLRVVGVSDPAQPQEVGFIDTPGLARGVTVAGGLAYVADSERGLRILDVSNPSAPREVAAYAPESDVRSVTVAVDGDQRRLAYLADRRNGVRVVDVEDPGAPQEVGRYDTLGYVNGVVVTGGSDKGLTAYVASGGDVRVVDVSNPAAPMILHSYATPGQASDVAMQEQELQAQLLYVADAPTWSGQEWEGGGLRVLALAAGELHEIAFVDTPGQAAGVAAASPLVYVADGNEGLHVIEASAPDNVSEIGQHALPGHTQDIAFTDDYAFIASSGQGVSVEHADLPDPAQEVGRFAGAPYARGVSVWGERLLVAEGIDPGDPMLAGKRGFAGGVHVLDISQPEQPHVLGHMETPGDVQNVAATGDMAVVADGDGGLLFVGVRN